MKFAYDEPGTPRGSAAETSYDFFDWRNDAKCRRDWQGQNPYIADNTSKRRARRLCAGCPVTAACLEDAKKTRRPGVAGGLTEAEWAA